MKKLFIITILLALLLCGCAEEAEIDPDTVNFAQCPTIATEEVESLPSLNAAPDGANYASDYAAAENGLFRLVQEDSTDSDRYVYFTDFISGETYPVCVRPNCTHHDYLCSAYVKYASSLHFDGSYLYFFVGNDCQLWRMAADGSDRKMLFEYDQDAEEGSQVTIGNAVYLDGKVYFDTYSVAMDPVTGKIETTEQLCVGDLKTGELSVLPISFVQNPDSGTLGVKGMYGGLLVLSHTNTISQIGSTKYEETIFLLDVNTLEVTVLYGQQWDSPSDHPASFTLDTIDDGYIIFSIYADESAQAAYSDGSDEYVAPGERLFVDLSQNKAYRMPGQDALIYRETILDGKWIHVRWNQEHTHVEKVAQDLSTGTVTLLPETVQHTIFIPPIQSAGDYCLVRQSGEDGYLAKADFWAGKTEITTFPN